MATGILDSYGRPFQSNGLFDGGYGGYGDMAVPQVLTFSAIIGSSYHTYLHGFFDEAVRHSREDALVMRRDAFLMGLLQERKLATASLKWHLEIPDEDDAYQVHVRDTLTKAIQGIFGFKRIIMGLLEALWYGRYAVQLIWKWKEVDGQRVLTVDKWQPVNGDKIGYQWDGTPYVLVNAFAGQSLPKSETIRTTIAPAVLLTGTWRERFIIHKHEIDDGDYFDAETAGGIHGVGIRHRVFWLDWLRREYLANVVTYMQRLGLGLTIWYFEDGNKASRAEAEKAAKEQSGRTNIIWPRSAAGKGYGSGIERIETSTTGADILLLLQKAIEDKIERYIIGQTLSSDSEGSGLGGTGVADLHADTKLKIIAYDAGNLGECLTGSEHETGFINLMKRYSFPDADFPVSFVFDVEKAESKEKLEGAKTLFDMGVELKADEVRAMAGCSKPAEGDETVGGMETLTAMAGMNVSKEGRIESADSTVEPKRNGEPARYEKEDEGKGRWVTIEGTHVFIENGVITKGPAHLTGKKVDSLEKRSGKPKGKAEKEEKEEKHPGSVHGSSVSVKKTATRAFDGETPIQTKTTLTKQETGRVGEAVILAYLKSVLGRKDARPMNAAETNFPIDMIEDHAPTEVKAGLVSNGRDAQKWRLTFSKESAKEKAAYEKMTAAEREAWNAHKQQRIRERKEAVIADLEKRTGKKIKPRTMTVVINPDTKTADIYEFDGFHDIIRWYSVEAKAAYKGSVTYA